jgi:glyoxylate reductase
MIPRVGDRVLVTRRITSSVVAKLDACFVLDVHDSDEPLDRDELLDRVAGAAGVLSMVSDRVDEAFLRAGGEELRVIANYAVGFDNIDVAAASRHRVVVANTPDVLSKATAELTLSLMLALVRRVPEGDRILRSATPWIWSPTWMIGRGLAGGTLGIVGLGRIGKEVARLATAFGMDVIYANRSGAVADAPYRSVTLEELLATADIVSLHCPLNDETRRLIGADEFARMKPDAVIVNTARGPVIDEAALVVAVGDRVIAGAALDVFEREPEVHSGLLELDSVVLTPHMGSGTAETREAMGELCLDALKAVIIDERCPGNALNPEAIRAP